MGTNVLYYRKERKERMRIMKKFMSLLLAGVLTGVLLTGCASTDSSATPQTGEESTETSSEAETKETETEETDAAKSSESALLQSIKEKGYITIASSNDAPFFYENIETGQIEGLDVVILQEICDRLGIQDIQMQVVDFSNLLVELNNGNVDMVADAMYIRDERLEVAYFSDVWYTESEAVVVRTDSEFTTKESLVDARMGAQPGTAFYETAEKWLEEGKIKELVGFENQSTLMVAVNTGRIDAAVTDGIVSAYTLAQDSSLELMLMSPYEAEAVGRIGAAVRFADKDFMAEINDTLNEMKEDGTLMQILLDFGLNEDYFVGVEDGATVNIQ